MKLSTETSSALDILKQWNESDTIYSLDEFRDLEMHDRLVKCELMEEWFDHKVKEEGYDFLEFGYNRAGDPYALWIYPGLKGEPPVVFLDGDGEVAMLAPSLGDFLYLLTDKDCCEGKIDNQKLSWYTIYKFQYKERVEDDHRFATIDDVKAAFNIALEDLRKQISTRISPRSTTEIIEAFNRHPDFAQWFEQTADF